jgi:hypothetical protein
MYLGSWLRQEHASSLNTIAPDASNYLQQAVLAQSQLGWDQ